MKFDYAWTSVTNRAAETPAQRSAGRTSPGIIARLLAREIGPPHANWSVFCVLEGFKIFFEYLERRVGT